MSDINCPICKVAMTTELYEGVHIDVCPNKDGTWLDYGEIKRILQSREKKFTPTLVKQIIGEPKTQKLSNKELESKVNCPICQEQMPAVNYQGVTGIIINTCDHHHGVWLDGEELDKIQVVMERWEDTLERNREKYSDLLENVKHAQEARMAENLKNLRTSNFEFINALVRRVIDWVL